MRDIARDGRVGGLKREWIGDWDGRKVRDTAREVQAGGLRRDWMRIWNGRRVRTETVRKGRAEEEREGSG